MHRGDLSVAIFAGDCFWSMETPFEEVPGVVSTVVGYECGDGGQQYRTAIFYLTDAQRRAAEKSRAVVVAHDEHVPPLNAHTQSAGSGGIP